MRPPRGQSGKGQSQAGHTLLLWVAPAALVVLVVAGGLTGGWPTVMPRLEAQPLPHPSPGPGTSIPIMGHDHLVSMDTPHPPYNSDPPTSGPHLVLLAPWGVYRIPIPKELQVHNLEDGGVLVQYACRDCPDVVKKLESIVTRYNRVVLAPYPHMEHRIALTAWGRLDAFDDVDADRIMRFIEAYIGIDHHPGGEQCKLPREVRL